MNKCVRWFFNFISWEPFILIYASHIKMIAFSLTLFKFYNIVVVVVIIIVVLFLSLAKVIRSIVYDPAMWQSQVVDRTRTRLSSLFSTLHAMVFLSSSSWYNMHIRYNLTRINYIRFKLHLVEAAAIPLNNIHRLTTNKWRKKNACILVYTSFCVFYQNVNCHIINQIKSKQL